MYTRIEWTSYQFKPPETVTEELYIGAKHSPADFRRQFINAHLINGLKRAALPISFFAGIGAGLLGIASLIDFKTSGGNWLGTILLVVGMGTIFSAILTAGSFIKYVMRFRQFWIRVAVTARDSDSYAEFLPLFEKRKTEKIGLDRELPFWLPWVVLIGIALAIYAAAVEFGDK